MAKLNPGNKTVFLEPTTSTALQYSCKLLTISAATTGGKGKLQYYTHFQWLLVRGSTTNFKAIYLVEIYICGKELMKTDGIAINAEL
jgi:hypothetical protein